MQLVTLQRFCSITNSFVAVCSESPTVPPLPSLLSALFLSIPLFTFFFSLFPSHFPFLSPFPLLLVCSPASSFSFLLSSSSHSLIPFSYSLSPLLFFCPLLSSFPYSLSPLLLFCPLLFPFPFPYSPLLSLLDSAVEFSSLVRLLTFIGSFYNPSLYRCSSPPRSALLFYLSSSFPHYLPLFFYSSFFFFLLSFPSPFLLHPCLPFLVFPLSFHFPSPYLPFPSVFLLPSFTITFFYPFIFTSPLRSPYPPPPRITVSLNLLRSAFFSTTSSSVPSSLSL